MTSQQAERAALADGVDTFALDRYTFDREDPRGLLLGFAAFDESRIRQGLVPLAAALECPAAR